MIKFKSKVNSKEAAGKWSQPESHTTIRPKSNYGILTGSKNNLIVLDVDVKDNGLEEFNEYIKTFGNIDTYTVRTPSGGLHLYFNYTSQKDADNYYLRNYLKTSSKYRGKGLDIRSDGGYIVGVDSKINGRSYSVIRNTAINDIPSSLVEWLLQSYVPTEPPKKKKTRASTSVFLKPSEEIEYLVNNHILHQILNSLDDKYSNDFTRGSMS